MISISQLCKNNLIVFLNLLNRQSAYSEPAVLLENKYACLTVNKPSPHALCYKKYRMTATAVDKNVCAHMIPNNEIDVLKSDYKVKYENENNKHQDYINYVRAFVTTDTTIQQKLQSLNLKGFYDSSKDILFLDAGYFEQNFSPLNEYYTNDIYTVSNKKEIWTPTNNDHARYSYSVNFSLSKFIKHEVVYEVDGVQGSFDICHLNLTVDLARELLTSLSTELIDTKTIRYIDNLDCALVECDFDTIDWKLFTECLGQWHSKNGAQSCNLLFMKTKGDTYNEIDLNTPIILIPTFRGVPACFLKEES